MNFVFVSLATYPNINFMLVYALIVYIVIRISHKFQSTFGKFIHTCKHKYIRVCLLYHHICGLFVNLLCISAHKKLN